jgi:ribosomal protein S18 acetylase RimI-like enzyme
MTRPALTIRIAHREDADLVAALVGELARQQGDPTEQISADKFRRDGFGDRPEFEALIAEQSGEVAGYALFHLSYEPSYSARGVYLCDLYVRPAARRRGVGRALAAATAHRAKELGRSYVWWVTKDWNEPALAFYRSLDAVATPVVAHALTFDTFEALVREGAGKTTPP